MDPCLVAIHANEQGVRLSRVTPHGEEVVEVHDPVVLQLAVKLWSIVAQKEPTGHAAVLPALEGLQAHLANVEAMLTKIVAAHGEALTYVAGLQKRLERLESLTQHDLTALRAAQELHTAPPPPPERMRIAR